jgi:hypothetical protein
MWKEDQQRAIENLKTSKSGKRRKEVGSLQEGRDEGRTCRSKRQGKNERKTKHFYVRKSLSFVGLSADSTSWGAYFTIPVARAYIVT